MLFQSCYHISRQYPAFILLYISPSIDKVSNVHEDIDKTATWNSPNCISGAVLWHAEFLGDSEKKGKDERMDISVPNVLSIYAPSFCNATILRDACL